jgi:hypothetical protein
MSGRPHPSRPSWRRFSLGSGPLKRTSDRVEFASRLVLALVLLLAAPAGELAGAAGYSAALSAAHAQAAARSEATATLLADPPDARARRGLTPVAPWAPVPASWTGPDGVPRTGTVQADARMRAGTQVTVWVDRAGRVVPAPLTGQEAAVQGLVTGLLTVIAVATAGACGHAGVLWLLARRRLRRWADDWAAVEPQWVSRFR